MLNNPYTTKVELWTSRPQTGTGQSTDFWPGWLWSLVSTGSTMSPELTSTLLVNQVGLSFISNMGVPRGWQLGGHCIPFDFKIYTFGVFWGTWVPRDWFLGVI